MRLVRESPAAEELEIEEQFRREAEKKANQQLLEEDKANLGLQVVQNINEYFFPKIEV